MSPQVKAMLQALVIALRYIANRTSNTFDDALCSFLELAIADPAGAQAQLAIGQHGMAAAKAAAASQPTEPAASAAGEGGDAKGKGKGGK
jgi:hypothetical protein